MSYKVEFELEWNQIRITTNKGSKYLVLLNETIEGSNLWVLNFILESGKPSNKEVYKTMSTIYNVLCEGDNNPIEKYNIREIISFITGDNQIEIDKKTKVFTRWIKSPWRFEIIENPTIDIQGRANKVYLKCNLLHIKKDEKYNVEIPKISRNIKFCFNCGSENNSYKFCPNCGVNLQQR